MSGGLYLGHAHLDDVRQRLERCKARGVPLLLLCDYVDPVRLRPPARDSAIPYQTLLHVCAQAAAVSNLHAEGERRASDGRAPREGSQDATTGGARWREGARPAHM